MTKFKSVLSDKEVTEIVSGLMWSSGDSLGFGKQVAEHIQQAVLAKLHEQEPVMHARTYNGEIDWGEACVTKENDGELLSALDYVDDVVALEHGYAVMPLYAHPFQIKGLADGALVDEGTKEHHRTTKNHTHNNGVAKILNWFDAHSKKINWGASFLDAAAISSLNESLAELRKNQSLESEVRTMVEMLEAREWADHAGQTDLGHRLEIAISTLHNELYEPITHIAEANKMVEPDHIPDNGKMVGTLKLSVDTKEVQGLVQAYLDSFEVELAPKSLRDEFAMAALNGLFGNNGGPVQQSMQSGWSLTNCTQSDIAEFSYSMADAMLEAQAAGPKQELARNQPCGCVVCYCENECQCQGCGAKNCGTHDVGDIPSPVYVDHIPDASKMVTPIAQRKIQSAINQGYSIMENAAVLVNKDGHAAIVNSGGAFYWVENEALAKEVVND